MAETITHPIEGYTSEEQVLFTASSYLIDRMVAAPEKIILPPVTKPSGELPIYISDHCTLSEPRDISFKRLFLTRMRHRFKPTDIPEKMVLDYRTQTPENWSHSLNLHIPLAFLVNNLVKGLLRGDELLILLGERTPSYILKLYQLFGLHTHRTDNLTKAHFIQIAPESWEHIQTERHKWVNDFIIPSPSYQKLSTPNPRLPPKVFLSRLGTRCLTNEQELERFLGSKGYVKIYPEHLSPEDQLRLFNQATDIVAIHGAGMGPLLYRSNDKTPLKLVEIFSPGHMSEHFRSMASLLGVNWVGVRGRLEARHIRDAYCFEKPFIKYSLSPFSTDIQSLDHALEHLNSREIHPQ